MRIYFVIVLLFILFVANSILAVPAYPGAMELKQPDGSTFNARKQGDEWFNWTETIDQRVIVYNSSNGFFEYAEIKSVAGEKQLAPSGIKVKDIDYNRPLEAPGFSPVTREDLKELRNNAMEKVKNR